MRNIFENESIVNRHNSLNLYSKNLTYAKEFFDARMQNMSGEEREILFIKLTTSLQFDIRTIEKDLDVQAVFETMNNRGKPLSTLEKLKNRLIYLTEKLIDEKEDKNNLRRKINDAWGKIYFCLAQNPNSILDEDIFLSHIDLFIESPMKLYSLKRSQKKKSFKCSATNRKSSTKMKADQKNQPLRTKR